MEGESHISRNERHELPRIPSELIERLTNVTDIYLHSRSEIRKAYLERFLSALQLRLANNNNNNKNNNNNTNNVCRDNLQRWKNGVW